MWLEKAYPSLCRQWGPIDSSGRKGHGHVFIPNTPWQAGIQDREDGQWRCLWEAAAVVQRGKDDRLI